MRLFASLGQISLRKKFFGLAVLCIAMAALPTYLYVNEVQKSVQFSHSEMDGLKPIELMLNIIRLTQLHRGTTTLEQADKNKFAVQTESVGAEIKASLRSLDAVIPDTVHQNASQEIKQLINEWAQVEQHAKQRQWSLKESYEAHTKLIQQELRFLSKLLDVYQLSLDPAEDGYFLIMSTLSDLPGLLEALAQLRREGTHILLKKELGFNERAQIYGFLKMSEAKFEEINNSIEKAKRANPTIKTELDRQHQKLKANVEKLTSLTRQTILEKTQLEGDPHQYFSTYSEGIDSAYAYTSFIIPKIKSILQHRIDKSNQTMFVLLSYTAAMMLIFAAVSIWMAWRLLAQLGGEPTYASGIVKTISDGNLDQEILASSEDSLLGHMRVMQKKLKENMQLKNDFISTVSHELRTPLTSICGGLGLVVGKRLGDLPKPAADVLEIAHRNALRLNDLINDILDIDKLAAGQVDFQYKPHSMNQLSQEVVETLKAYAEKCGVTLQLVQTLELDSVNVDARRVQQVMMNFISNAAKFSPAGAEVKIKVLRQQNRLRFEVVDQGSGIPTQFHDRIFSRFAQVDSSDTKKVGGTGLGLAISKEIINRMGGEIGFHSTPQGSVFFFEFNGTNK